MLSKTIFSWHNMLVNRQITPTTCWGNLLKPQKNNLPLWTPDLTVWQTKSIPVNPIRVSCKKPHWQYRMSRHGRHKLFFLLTSKGLAQGKRLTVTNSTGHQIRKFTNCCLQSSIPVQQLRMRLLTSWWSVGSPMMSGNLTALSMVETSTYSFYRMHSLV